MPTIFHTTAEARQNELRNIRGRTPTRDIIRALEERRSPSPGDFGQTVVEGVGMAGKSRRKHKKRKNRRKITRRR